MSLIALRIAP